jgi:hypothetical protein
MRFPGLAEDIERCTQLFLSGTLDHNLPTIFNSLSSSTLDLACLRLFYAQASVEETLQLLGQSALAQANKFRLRGGWLAKRVPITWAGTTREVKTEPVTSLHNTGGILAALVNAKLANRSEDLAFLAGLPQKSMVNPWVRQPELTLAFTGYLQSLFAETSTTFTNLDALETGMLSLYSDKNPVCENNPDCAYIRAKTRAYIALGRTLRSANSKANEAALQASVLDLLAAHRDLFDSERDNMRWSVPGLLCFNALGIAALARSHGLDLATDDPYLPLPLLARVNT